jgi:hypothetical protein
MDKRSKVISGLRDKKLSENQASILVIREDSVECEF